MDTFKENKKYTDILISGKDLFWKHGFRRVTIEEICKKARVSKMTYYKFFPNKIELAKTVFRSVVKEGQDTFRRLMEEEISVSEKMQKMLMLKLENTNHISREFLQDFYLGSEPELQVFVEEITTASWTEILKEFRIAQKNGIFRKDFKPEFLLQVSYKLVEMLNDEKLAGLYDSPQDLIMEFSHFMVYGISPRDCHDTRTSNRNE